jgi:hypothetical protein
MVTKVHGLEFDDDDDDKPAKKRTSGYSDLYASIEAPKTPYQSSSSSKEKTTAPKTDVAISSSSIPWAISTDLTLHPHPY